jgi:tetratricopeptide (TPR) repeat protein
LIFGFGLTVFAQKKASEKQANSLFEKVFCESRRTVRTSQENQNVLQNLGDCYYNNTQMKDAVRVYGKLFLTYKDSVQPQYYFRYAHALLGIADYAKADIIMAEYLKFPVSTPKFCQPHDQCTF